MNSVVVCTLPPGSMSFFDLLEQRIKSVDSLLCVGLDPHRAQLLEPGAQAAFVFCRQLIEQTKLVAAAYKPNAAFFEAFGAEGWQALTDVVKLIPRDIPVLLDAKRGDISTTAEAYSQSLKGLGATGVTLHGYMGFDSVEPFLAEPEHGVFILCKTSNATSDDVQSLTCSRRRGEQRYLYEEVAALAGQWASACQNRIGLVVGATDTEALQRVRDAVPQMWILAPGIGAQGGDLNQACAAGLSSGGSKLLVPVSRGISKAADPAAAAETFRVAINEARCRKQEERKCAHGPQLGLKAYQRDFIRFAIETEVLLLGSFTLKSGRKSPYFFNAGRFNSGLALQKLGIFYAKSILDAHLDFDVLFGPAYKGITLASTVAVALAELTGRDVPFAYNRKEAKEHGEGGQLVGADLRGRKVLIVDDVITAGTAVRQSMELLATVDAKVVGVVLALDRQERGTNSPLSAVQAVEKDFGLQVISIVCLDSLLAFFQNSSMGHEVMESIRAYREQYGITT